MELKQYLKIIWKRLWILIAIPMVAGGISVFYCMHLTPYYTANTSLYVIDSTEIARDGINYNSVIVGQSLAKNYAQLITSRSIAQAVIDELGYKNMAPGVISSMISVSPIEETSVLVINITDTNPTEAMNIANAVANEFSKKAIELMKVDTVSIIDKAQKPEYPSGPNKTRTVALAVFVALLVAAGIIFLIEYLDNTIKTKDDIEKYLGLNVIGTIPRFGQK